MSAFQLFLSVDPSLGRVDFSSMSDQTLMEIIMEGFNDRTKKEYLDIDGMYLDVCAWRCIECNDEQRVIKINIHTPVVSGSLEICYVPLKVRVLSIRPLWVNGNLKGSVDLDHLSEAMEELSLGRNQLTGKVNLTHLPGGMQRLLLNHNQLTGEIDLTQLPGGMEYLYLHNNQFTGGVDLTQLPDGMGYLFFQNNQLSGSFVIERLTRGICINAEENHFNAVAVVGSNTDARVKLSGSGVTSVVDENGREQDINRFS